LGEYAEVLFLIGGLVILLFIGRTRGATLVKAGRVTRRELDGFVLLVFVVFSVSFLLIGVLQALSSEPDIFCLITFPPRRISGAALWLGQIVLSGSAIWWMRTRNGADLVARLAPAFFTPGPVLERRFSPRMVRLVVTSVAVLAPLSNIVIQLNHPIVGEGCSAVYSVSHMRVASLIFGLA
jgi:hypothetical protein